MDDLTKVEAVKECVEDTTDTRPKTKKLLARIETLEEELKESKDQYKKAFDYLEKLGKELDVSCTNRNNSSKCATTCIELLVATLNGLKSYENMISTCLKSIPKELLEAVKEQGEF